MKCWRPKLLEALIVEDMKSQIVSAIPNIQIGGMPGHNSTEHLVTLKTWMKQLEESKESGILSLRVTFRLHEYSKPEGKCNSKIVQNVVGTKTPEE